MADVDYPEILLFREHRAGKNYAAELFKASNNFWHLTAYKKDEYPFKTAYTAT